MNKYKGFKTAVLAASIALAMGSTSAMAAAPTATQLPGVGTAGGTGTVSAGTITNGTQTINITGNTVINWGKAGGTINKTQPGGFNIGSGAALNFAGQSDTGVDAVLNIDSSGNPSQIFGALTGTSVSDGTTNVFVANANGIIVGAGAQISSDGQVGLIANTLGDTSTFTGDVGTISYNGTGGNVTVMTGADVSGSTVFVSGGGTVNLDLSSLTGGDATLSAGLPQVGGSFATKNTSAVLAVSGSQDASIVGFSSAGTASNSGSLELGSADVAGTFTNTGTLYLDSGFAIDGALVNQKTVFAGDDVSFGALTNNGEFNADGNVTSGTFNNSGLYAGGSFAVDGDLNNNGLITLGGGGSIAVTNGNLTNGGSITSINDIAVTDGNLVNNGNITMIGDMTIINGSITNSATATLSGVHNIHTQTNDDADANSDYSITNAGTIEFGGDNSIYANSEGEAPVGTGSFTNTGTLMMGDGDDQNLSITAHDDINLGGTLKAMNGAGKYAAISEANPLAAVTLQALNGTLSLTQALAFTDESLLSGEQVKLMADVLGGDGSSLEIQVGDKVADDYTIRIANGVTVSSSDLNIHGRSEDDHPNMILQGTLAGNHIGLGVSDLYSGPNGGIVATGDNPNIDIDFTGAIKTAPYLNDANNFRYNYLPITVTGSDPVEMDLNPAAYQTNGTSNGKSAVNILVNGSVYLVTNGIPDEAAQGSAVTGVINWPNTHLVLQSTGNIATDGNDYWPGYVYLGTISSDANGALPGTLGVGQITLGGDLNNVLPGSIDNGGGIHFITQFPLVMNNDATVTTNANSWVNFGTDTLTNAYASGTFGAGQFFGGAKGPGNVVNYGELDPSMFQTQGPNSAK